MEDLRLLRRRASPEGGPGIPSSRPVGGAPFSVAIAPDGRRAYVTNTSSNSVDVLINAE